MFLSHAPEPGEQRGGQGPCTAVLEEDSVSWEKEPVFVGGGSLWECPVEVTIVSSAVRRVGYIPPPA